MSRTGFQWTAAAALCGLLLSPAAQGEEPKPDARPRVIAFAPLDATPGASISLRVRGVKLENVTAIRFSGAAAPVAAEIKEKKKADVPNGLDVKDVGDTQAEIALTLPAELAPGALSFVLSTPDGDTAPRELQVLAAGSVVDEKEPNNGFRDAQPIEYRKTLRGSIKEDKDVDVYRITGRANERIAAEIFAARRGSLLDAALTLFDSRGHLICAADDVGASRDPLLTAVLPVDGEYFLTVQDAGDRGGTWHAYELIVKEAAR